GDYYVGDNCAFSLLRIQNGGGLFASGNGIIGNTFLAKLNSALVNGTGSAWSNQLDLYVGNSGANNQLTISNHGAVFNGYGYVGANSGSVSNGVTVTGTGSIWSNQLDLSVGYNGANNQLTI